MDTPRSPNNVFLLQQKALPILLGWSVGSITAGVVWRSRREQFWQGLGEQFIGWGLVDGLISLAGLRGAARSERRYLTGAMDSSTYKKTRRNFFWLLAGNTLLDAGYLWGGRQVLAQAGGREKRRGMGWGILVQGFFLLVWDSILMILLGIAVDET